MWVAGPPDQELYLATTEASLRKLSLALEAKIPRDYRTTEFCSFSFQEYWKNESVLFQIALSNCLFQKQ